MAVNEGARTHGHLEAQIKARDLASYTYKICDNKKVFDPQHESLILRIEDLVTNICLCCWHANNIRVNKASDWDERSKLQKKADRLCGDLLCIMQISKPVFHLRERRIKYWGGMACETQDKIRAWHQGDCKRYSQFSENQIMISRA